MLVNSHFLLVPSDHTARLLFVPSGLLWSLQGLSSAEAVALRAEVCTPQEPLCMLLLCASDCHCALTACRFRWKEQSNAGIKHHVAIFTLYLECQVWSHADAGGDKTECSEDRKEVFAKADTWCYKAGFVRTLIELAAESRRS